MKITLKLTNLNYKDIVGSINVGAGKIVGVLGLSTANKAAVSVINTFKKPIISKITEIIEKQELKIDIDTITASESDNNSVVLDVYLLYVDAVSLIRVLCPVLEKVLEKNEKLSSLGDFLCEKEGLVCDCVGEIFRGLTEPEKDKLLCDIINCFDEKLIDLIEKSAKDNGVTLTVIDLVADNND